VDIIKEKIFRRIAVFSCAHSQPSILGALFLGRPSGFLITGLQFQKDMLNLLLSNVPQRGAFVKFLKDFGSGASVLSSYPGPEFLDMVALMVAGFSLLNSLCCGFFPKKAARIEGI
jgi:hypothetical protein